MFLISYTVRDQGLRKITELEENGSFKQACNNDRQVKLQWELIIHLL